MSLFDYLSNIFYFPLRIFNRIFDYLNIFPYGNPMTKEDEIDFTKSLSPFITSRFSVQYDSEGMTLRRKENSGLVAKLA